VSTTLPVFISTGGLFLALFVGVLLLALPWGVRRANRVLAVLMFAFSLAIGHPLISGPLQNAPMHAAYGVDPLQFLLAPLVAAYFRSILVPTFRVRPGHLVHALPFAAVLALTLTHLVPQGTVTAPALVVAPWGALVAQLVLYVLPSLRLLHRQRAALRGQVATTQGVDAAWLAWFSRLMVVLVAGYATVLVVLIHNPRLVPPREALSLALTVVAAALGFRGLLQKEPPVLDNAPSRSQRPPMPIADLHVLQDRLTRAMEAERLFLDPDLDLSRLAERVRMSRNQVSYAINEGLGKSFYDFVNEHRVNEVLRLMRDPSRSRHKLLSLAFDAGFSSKPTFNTVFKKLKGLTPSEYRRRNNLV
jgi:AraC-like DNA-binding protein